MGIKLGKYKVDKFYKIIPKPNVIVPKSEEFEINRETIICRGEKLKSIAQYLQDFLNKEYKLELNTSNLDESIDKSNLIFLLVDENRDEDPEGYHLSIEKEKITVTAKTQKGVFYGIQSLIQMIYQATQESNSHKLYSAKLNCVEIHDAPRFKWRGFMLDEARHFFGKEVVKNIFDVMASLKFNTFHWHLTDDQGWRIEIKKYPRLIEVGSKRKGTKLAKSKIFINSSVDSKETDGIPVVGFYSQEDIKEIIDYAAERYIRIIPEIDLPGHTMALLASYPELSCTGGPFEVGTQFGIYRDVLCVGKESVFKVLEDVLREVIDLFPSKFIHIGGDEAPRTRWKKCPNCQARMVKEKIEDINGLQTYFTNRISEFLIAEGKEVVSWNETIDKFLNKEINCQYWSGSYEEVLNELKNGRKVVISEINFNYFNYPYRLNSLKHTYQFDPIPEGLPEEFHENILGIEACVWTELIKTKDKLEWQLFPRLIATAEIGWTQKNMRNYQDFEHRLEILLKEFEKNGINFSIKEEYDGNHTNRAERYLRGT